MKYTKQQGEMLALLVLMGCAIVILSFLYLVKPTFATISKCKMELKKTEGEITELSKVKVALARAKKEMDGLKGTIEDGEGAIFSGLEIDPPLADVCVVVANKTGLKPAYGAQTSKSLLEFRERGADGKEVTRHYDEVSRTLDIQSADFLTLCRFLSGVENANKGLMVTHLKIDRKSSGSQELEKGEVNAQVELSVLGIREGVRERDAVDVTGTEDFDVGKKRNPFGPATGLLVSTEDPGRRIKDALRSIKISGVWSDELIMAVPKSGTITVRKGETFVVGRVKMKYVSGVAETFVFEAVDSGRRYELITNSRGEVKKVTEEERK